MEIKLQVKNGKGTVTVNGKEINLPVIDRKGKKCEYQKFEVKTSKAILPVWAKPKTNVTVNLKEIGTSAHAHKTEKIETKNLIVGRGYFAKQGQKITIR